MPAPLQDSRPTTAHPKPPILRRRSFWFMLFCGIPILLASTCLGLLISPSINVDAFDQNFAISAQAPSFSLRCQANMTEVGLAVPLQDTWSYGPVCLQAKGALLNLRGPSLQAGGRHDGMEIAYAWGTYVLWRSLIVLGIAGLLWALVLNLRISKFLPQRRILAFFVVVFLTTVVDAGFEASGTVGLMGLTHANLGQIFETEAVSVPPPPKRLKSDTMSEGAVIGESVASHLGGTGNPRLPCLQSADSLAFWLTQFTGYSWRNLACSGASIREGLIGPQPNGNTAFLQPQVDQLPSIKNLKQVVVVIGPDDVGWTFQMGLCYFTASCNNDLGETDFSLRLSQFVVNYAKLLSRLSQLPSRPEVTVVLQYQLMSPAATLNPGCLDASNLTQAEIQLMRNYVDQLNQVLSDGAKQFHYLVASPHLNELCAPPGVSQDIYPVLVKPGQFNSYAAHPTPQGERKIARAVLQVLPDSSATSASDPVPSQGSVSPSPSGWRAAPVFRLS